MKEKIGRGTLANILFIGLWEDFFLHLLPSFEIQPIRQYITLLIAIISMGIATAVYIGVDAGAGLRDSLMLAVNRTFKVSLRVTRDCIELSVVLIGWLLGGPLGIGTLIFQS